MPWGVCFPLTSENGDLVGDEHGDADGGVHVGAAQVAERLDEHEDDEAHGEPDLDRARVHLRVAEVQRHRALHGHQEERRHHLQTRKKMTNNALKYDVQSAAARMQGSSVCCFTAWTVDSPADSLIQDTCFSWNLNYTENWTMPNHTNL